MQRRHGTGDHFSQDGNAYIFHESNATDDINDDNVITNCDTTWSGGCDCKVFNSAIQCTGYAWWTYYEHHGTTAYSTIYSSQNYLISNTESFITYMNSIPLSAYVSVDNHGHKFTLVRTTERGINNCHANTQYAGRYEPPETHCLVYNNEYLTYQELVNENWGSITTIRVKPE